MPLMGAINTEIGLLDESHVAMCATEQAAMRLCILGARVYQTQSQIADALSMTKGNLNTILNSDQNDRPRYLPRTKQIQLQRLCGNRAIDQWADLYEKGRLTCQITKERQIADLEIMIGQLKGSDQGDQPSFTA